MAYQQEPFYLPSEEEIQIRMRFVRVANFKGWNQDFIKSVLVDDCPSLDLFLKFESLVGQDEAYRRLEGFWRDCDD